MLWLSGELSVIGVLKGSATEAAGIIYMLVDACMWIIDVNRYEVRLVIACYFSDIRLSMICKRLI